MSTNVAAIRAGFVTALAGITAVRWYDKFPGQIVGPAGVVRRQTYNYGVDFDGDGDAIYAVSIYLPLTDPESAQVLMDSLLSTSGTNSVSTAIEAAPTLGGTVQWLNVDTATEDGIATVSGIDNLTATITVQVGGA
jgi:hypothetical protein